MSYQGEVSLDAPHWEDDEITLERPAVLIVDDHPANLIALEAVLGPLDVRLVHAHSGEEALERSAEHEFAVALLDLRMPGLNGVETARRLRALNPTRQTPIMILTAHLPELQEIRTAYAAGVVDFLQKPYAAEVLAAKVNVFVQLLVQREKLRLYEQALRKRFEQQLVGIVSHDLRTPLNAISLAAEVLLRRHEAAGDRRTLEIIQSAAGRATRLIHDLLDYTQVLHGTEFAIKRERLCWFQLTQELVEELKASFPTTEFVVEQTGTTEGLWDRDRLAQVVTNLIGNASTYGSGAPIRVQLVGRDAEVSLHVHNQGEPIAADLIPELFKPLKRGDKTAGRGSVGLGLFIVNEIARAHGGCVAVRSTVDHGTTFSVTLPRGTRFQLSSSAGD